MNGVLVDRYYTPEPVADRVVRAADELVTSCIDTGCGTGSLLLAAERQFGSVTCYGLDIDAVAVAGLRRLRPNWRVSAGDMLGTRSVARLASIRAARGCDWLFLNPPFSRPMGVRGIHTHFYGTSTYCSAGMSFLLKSLAVVSPTLGAVAIVPESLMHSELDYEARRMLSSMYTLCVIEETSCYTFKGARARALIVRVSSGAGDVSGDSMRPADPAAADLRVTMVRGGLPVFEALYQHSGLRFLHSTTFPKTSGDLDTSGLPKVVPLVRGLVRGNAVFLPRVGVPVREHIWGVRLRETVQLSDCVVALMCRSFREARRLGRYLREHYDELCAIYRGTGARYITCARLKEWLQWKLGHAVMQAAAFEE